MQLTTGYEFTTNEALAASKLNAMLDDAIPFGMVTADLQTNYNLLDIATSQPTPTLGYPWVDNDCQLRFGNGSFFQYGSGVIRLTNISGVTLTRGAVVRLIPGGFTRVDTTLEFDGRVFGVLLDASVANGADGFLMYRGICQVQIGALSFSGGYGTNNIPGSFIYGYGLVPGTAIIIAPPTTSPDAFSLFGVMLQTGDASSFTPGLYVCKVWK